MIINLYILKHLLQKIVFGLFHITEHHKNKYFLLIYLLKQFLLLRMKINLYLELISPLHRELIYSFLFLEELMKP